MRTLLGQVIALTKAILLKPKQPADHSWLSFIAGKKSSFAFHCGIGLSWWADEVAHNKLEAVASLVVSEHSEFKDCDHATVQNTILATLQELCLDNTIFFSDDVLLMKKATLFDCHRLSVPEFAEAILNAVKTNLRAEIGKVCTVVVLPRFVTRSFQLQNGSLHVVSKDDASAWQILMDKDYVFDGWSPLHPKQDGRDDQIYTPTGRMDTVLAAEDNGTLSGVHFNSLLRFRQLIALLYAVVSDRSKYPIHKSIASPSEFCVQFTHRDRSEWHLRRRDCRPLVPTYADDIVIHNEEMDFILQWYTTLEHLCEEAKGRAEKGAHFFNRAMNSDEIESFVNYFICLDAIFGERNSVEASILEGLAKIGVSSQDVEKARWLFELRSELVHGGSRYVAEWPKYVRYRDHFGSEPQSDVQRLARMALLRAPGHFAKQDHLLQASNYWSLRLHLIPWFRSAWAKLLRLLPRSRSRSGRRFRYNFWHKQ